MPDQQTHTFTVVPPTQEGSYYQRYGWTVLDSHPLAPEFATPFCGIESEAKRYAAAMNRRVREGSL
jgi:hypothetical protein